MDKIICSLEDWDSILDYYRPNGSSKTWYIKELKILTLPLMWAEWTIFTEQGEMFGEGHLRNTITPNYSNLIQYTPKDKIGESSHIYIINVYDNHFFYNNRDLGFKCISENYLNDIRNGKSKILMFFIYEGYSGTKNNNDFEVIEKWRVESNLPVDSIYYVCGNLLSDKIVKERGHGYQARGIHYFEPWNKYGGNLLNFNPLDDRYLFLSYNRQYRHHRIRFMIDLLDKDLINKGLISLNKLNDVPYETSDENKDFLINKTPLIIDSLPDLTYNLAINITNQDYERTFMSVVTETLADDNTLFFSEKIWKPIMVGHPFMVYGNQGSIRYLKNLGFKTYDKWFDESYDDEPDRDMRSKMIVNELERLSKKSLDELKSMRDEMKETCEYNFNFYKQYYFEKYGNNDQSKTIREILLEVWSSISDIKPKPNLI